MTYYIVRRLVILIPTVWALVTLVFAIFRFVPGDPASVAAGPAATAADIDLMRERMGLTAPVYVQYLSFLSDLLHGDLGQSLFTRENVTDLIRFRFPATLQLTITAMALSVSVGLITGIIAALRRGSWWDYLSMTLGIIGSCVPNFWVALMLILFFSVRLGWFPSIGRQEWDPKYLVLPSLALASPLIAIITRLTRSSMLEVMDQDYIVLARAKGLRERAVVLRHGLRNALIPIITIVGLQFGALLGGTVVVETIFSWPGMGWMMITGITQRDYSLVQGVLIIYATLFMLITLIVDLAYAFLDPRVQYG